MDPITLFALANGAVAAVKQGCKLYKEIASAAGDVKGILGDLESQFHSAHKDRPPTVSEHNQYVQEKNRVIELSKKQPDDVYTIIGENLGAYFENMATCMAIFEEEERHAYEVYEGPHSVGKRALQRVLMQSKLQSMQAELREIMVYQCPPELGDLYTKVEKMMVKIQEEQSIAIRIRMKNEREAAARKIRRIEKIKCEAWKYGLALTFMIYFIWLVWSVVQVRIDHSPELGRCLIPKGTWPYEHYNNLKWIDCEIKGKT
jgi:rubrerythrin